MDIAILHCHFERGGVTQVVENHVRALASCNDVDRIFLVTDHRQGGLSAETQRLTESIRIAGFDYDPGHLSPGTAPERARELTKSIEEGLAAAGLDRQQTVLHWHNHALGKNTAAPAVVRRLATSGWRLLLQVHDFAEDSRPENYLALIEASSVDSSQEMDEYLYPVATQIHYATLTGGDAKVLSALGIPDQRIHCLPNSVTLPSGQQPDQQESLQLIRQVMSLPDHARWCLYPVRGIRRKNVGEFLLMCRWLAADCFGGLTLRPATPLEARSYDRWRRIANEVSPRAVFDAAHHQGVTFSDNLAASDFVISTSVAEGFGMAFLEPWLAGRGVIARRLPGVTDDFASAGVKLSSLYDTVPVPGDAAWLRECRGRSAVAFDDAWASLPIAFRPQANEVMESDTIDFARLTPGDQVTVLRRLAESSDYERAMKELSADLIRHFSDPPSPAFIDANAEVVDRHYSTKNQAGQLQGIYETLLAAEIEATAGGPSGDLAAVDLVSQTRPYYPCRTESQIDE